MNSTYDINKLPDFYSVRDYDQLDYSLEGLEGTKCFAFFYNGFTSNVIEPNKRDIRFIWDGFLLFVDNSISLDDIRNGIDLYGARLVALQRTNLLHQRFNTNDVQEYIANKLNKSGISMQIMPDKNEVDGYPSKGDLWSTRDKMVLMDATECSGDGVAYYFDNADFRYKIKFPDSNLPDFNYQHNGALVLKGENSTAISRLILNDKNLQDNLEKIIGEEKVFSYLEQRNITGTLIKNIKSAIKK